MYTLIISSICAGLTFLVLFGFFGLIPAIIPAILVLVGAFFLISRSMAKKLEIKMKKLQGDLMAGRIENALLALREIKRRYGAWQLYLGATIDGQIGSIYYMQHNYKKAKPYLEKSFVRHWVAKAMLAVIYYREKKYDKMNDIFENTTRYVKKVGLLWSLWAYCMWRQGKIDRAINILAQGKKYLEEKDPHLTQNLLLLQNQKRMKMKSYGDQWYQFQLEVSPGQQTMRQGRVRFRNR